MVTLGVVKIVRPAYIDPVFMDWKYADFQAGIAAEIDEVRHVHPGTGLYQMAETRLQ